MRSRIASLTSVSESVQPAVELSRRPKCTATNTENSTENREDTAKGVSVQESDYNKRFTTLD
jgi:hypothetical protein